MGVIAVARTADVILMMLDATKGEQQKEKLTKELEAVGIRLNARKPAIYFKKKGGGGITFTATCKLTRLTEKIVFDILKDNKIHNAEVLVKEDASVDDFVDVLVGNRLYLKCVYCYNKIDCVTVEEMDRLARLENSVVISCHDKLNLDYLLATLWEKLALVRIYTKKPGQFPDFASCIILRGNSTIEHVCHGVHRSIAENFKYAVVWGRSVKFSPQRVGISHAVCDEDVIQLVKKSTV